MLVYSCAVYTSADVFTVNGLVTISVQISY